MKKLLQIDACLNWGSTGKIAEGIALAAQKKGWDCYMLHGSRYNRAGSVMKDFQPGSVIDEYCHYVEHRLFDNDGLASRHATVKAVEYIKQLKPDIIQIHTIHDHWLNYKLLFEYLITLNTPIVWTQHDCWSFTGGCFHFSIYNCCNWREGGCLNGCPQKKPLLGRIVESTQKQYGLKKALFTATKNLTIITVSKWLEGLVKESFLKDKSILTIYNGVDLDVFHPRTDMSVLQKYQISEFQYVVAAATAWNRKKGLFDYYKLSTLLDNDIKIVLVGLQGKYAKEAQKYGIIALPRTESQQELAVIYSSAVAILNLSYEESFGLTSVEGFGCGRPTVVYDCTASPELVGDSECGRVLEGGNVVGVAAAIEELLKENQDKITARCRERALDLFDKKKRFADYVNLYENLMKK